MILANLCPSNSLANPLALTTHSVPMVSYRLTWHNMQTSAPAGPTSNPNDPSYSWTFIDSCFAQAAAFNKQVFLRINVQESDAPSWLKPLVAQYIAVSGSSFNIWWNTNYIAYMSAMIQAVATRYGANPLWKVFACNFAASGTGDWSMPHVASQSNSNNPPNWKMQTNVPCPAYGNSVVVTPVANTTIYVGWIVYRNNFGWFQVTSITGPNNNPTSATLLNLGYSGNASSGTIGNSGVWQVSDVQMLTSPAYNYTTSQVVNALNTIINVATAALPSTVIYSHEVGRNGTLDPYPNSGTTYQYNAATQMAQYGYSHVSVGKWAIGKNTIQAQTETPANALSRQDNSSFFLPAQCLPGSTNTSGTTGSIPAGSLLDMQFNWNAYDVTGLYSPTSTGNKNGPYAANGGVPYDATNVLQVFRQTLALGLLYGVHVMETYQVDVINLLPYVGAFSNVPEIPQFQMTGRYISPQVRRI